MRTRFVKIILFIILFFPGGTLPASLPSSEDINNITGHSMLSCLDCHSLIEEDPDHPSFEESNTSCLECHDNFSEFPHNRRFAVKCVNCHSRHSERITHDAHSGISCKVCHLSDIQVQREFKNGSPVWTYEPEIKGEYDPHRLITDKDEICSRCHYKGNRLGAPNRALPAKSIICMPCHAATLTIGDIPSAIAVIIFLTGIVSLFFLWLSSGKGHRKNEERKYSVFVRAIKILIFDVFFQQRLLKVSVKRWIIHEMIFFPLVLRFMWGMAGLVLSLIQPEWNITWTMLDKNNPVAGFIFDISGLMILTGGCLMAVNKMRDRKNTGIKDLPGSNAAASALLGGMIITGFIVEGARIAMTDSPEGSQFAFIGYLISRILSDCHLNGIYAYLWYLHAFLTAVFIAFLPFSRMFHVFVAPLSLFFRGTSGE